MYQPAQHSSMSVQRNNQKNLGIPSTGTTYQDRIINDNPSTMSAQDWNDYYYGFNANQAMLAEGGVLGAASPSWLPSGKLYERTLAAYEEEKQNRANQYEQWYNSEEQQVARMKAAGMNPDLLGTESASEVQQDTFQHGQFDNSGSMLTNLLPLMFQGIETFQNIEANQLTNESKRIENAAKIYGIAKDFTGDQEYGVSGADGYKAIWENLLSGKTRMSRATRAKFQTAMENILGHSVSTDTAQMAAQDKNEQAEFDLHTNQNKRTDEISQLLSDFYKETLEASRKENKFKSDYYDHAEGKDKGLSDMADWSMSVLNKNNYTKSQQGLTNLIDKFDTNAKKADTELGRFFWHMGAFLIYRFGNAQLNFKSGGFNLGL